MASKNFIRFFRHLNWQTLKQTFTKTIENRLLGLAAEIAFQAMLSLFPAILALFTAIGLYAEALQDTFNQLAIQLSRVIPHDAWKLIQEFATQEIANSKNSSLFSLSFAIALWTASGAISTTMMALDIIQQIPPNKRRTFWQAKLISLSLTIGHIFLLILASFLVFISDSLLSRIVQDRSSLLFLLHIWQLLQWPVALGIIVGAFSFIYLCGPSIWKSGTPLLPGAFLAAIFWAILSALFRLYVTNFGNYNKVYGTVGTFIVLMLWLWITAFVLLGGYQLNVTIGKDMQLKDKKSSRKTIIKSSGRKQQEGEL
ncbi:MAG TPA: YihY/virulence factor BrkB family protein [Nostocaceae cyanobacterium]|nr:YihY/virulence factor BrkB family protein [Nostocaceae cyanobacterium]